jgi:hypothetical protein
VRRSVAARAVDGEDEPGGITPTICPGVESARTSGQGDVTPFPGTSNKAYAPQ